MTATVNIALLVLRLAIGLTIAAHGAQKGFGWFGGPGAAKVAQGFQAQGLRPGWFWTSLVLLGVWVANTARRGGHRRRYADGDSQDALAQWLLEPAARL